MVRVLKNNSDRNLLISLINKEITFRQFVTRVFNNLSGSNNICVDDLRAYGIDERFLNPQGNKNKEMLTMIDQQVQRINIEEMKYDPKYIKQTPQFFRRIQEDEFNKNKWRNDARCIKSINCVIDQDIKDRQLNRLRDEETHAGF